MQMAPSRAIHKMPTAMGQSDVQLYVLAPMTFLVPQFRMLIAPPPGRRRSDCCCARQKFRQFV